MKNTGCGYEPCTCRGVHFISRYRSENDYCIDGHRVTLRDGSQVVHRASRSEAERLGLFLLDEYADYVRWHVAQKQKAQWEVPLGPFNHAWPLIQGHMQDCKIEELPAA